MDDGSWVYRYKNVLVWSLLTAGIAATDWPIGLWGDFWTEHSLAAGLASGLILLGFGIFVVEAWLKEREVKRWIRVAAIAFKALATGLGDLTDTMGVLARSGSLGESHIGPDGVTRLNQVMKRFELDLDGLASNDVAGRLAILMTDPEWADVAFRAVDAAKHRHRAQLAQWSAVMISTDRLARRFERIARLNDDVYEMQEPMRALRRPNDFDSASLERARTDVSEAWQRLLRDSVALREDLMRDAGHRGWVWDGGRTLLPSNVLAELQGADAKGRIVPSVGPEAYLARRRQVG